MNLFNEPIMKSPKRSPKTPPEKTPNRFYPPIGFDFDLDTKKDKRKKKYLLEVGR